MAEWLSDFEEFNKICETEEHIKDVDYLKYIKALEIYTADRLGLTGDEYVILKPVYLHQTKIHSLIFNICKGGRRYSARLIRRVSLCLRERESDNWFEIVLKAKEIALSMPPVGLDPKLESLPIWVASRPLKSRLRMTFKINASEVIINAVRIIDANGKIDEIQEILRQLRMRGL